MNNKDIKPISNVRTDILKKIRNRLEKEKLIIQEKDRFGVIYNYKR
jgi:hypothetical protein